MLRMTLSKAETKMNPPPFSIAECSEKNARDDIIREWLTLFDAFKAKISRREHRRLLLYNG